MNKYSILSASASLKRDKHRLNLLCKILRNISPNVYLKKDNHAVTYLWFHEQDGGYARILQWSDDQGCTLCERCEKNQSSTVYIHSPSHGLVQGNPEHIALGCIRVCEECFLLLRHGSVSAHEGSRKKKVSAKPTRQIKPPGKLPPPPPSLDSMEVVSFVE